MEHNDRNDIMELIYAIANIAHAEYHLIEALIVNKDIIPEELPEKVQEMRNIRVSLMAELQVQRPNIGGLWCVFKHLILTEFHLMELYERDLNYKYLEEAQKIHLLLDELLGIEGIENFKSCPRCDDDKEQK